MTEVRLVVDGTSAPAGLIAEIAEVIRSYPGHSPVYLTVETPDSVKTLLLREPVEYGPEFYLAIREIGCTLQIR